MYCQRSWLFRVLYPSMLTESLVGRKKCGRKRCTTNRENRSLMRIVKQNQFKNLGELHNEWTNAGVKASRATTHRCVKEFNYSCRQRRLSWAKEKKNWTVAQWSKVLFSDGSKFCISFGNQGPRVRVEKLIAQVYIYQTLLSKATYNCIQVIHFH